MVSQSKMSSRFTCVACAALAAVGLGMLAFSFYYLLSTNATVCDVIDTTQYDEWWISECKRIVGVTVGYMHLISFAFLALSAMIAISYRASNPWWPWYTWRWDGDGDGYKVEFDVGDDGQPRNPRPVGSNTLDSHGCGYGCGFSRHVKEDNM